MERYLGEVRETRTGQHTRYSCVVSGAARGCQGVVERLSTDLGQTYVAVVQSSEEPEKDERKGERESRMLGIGSD